MFLKTYNFTIVLLLGAESFGAIQTTLAQAPSIPVNAFSDPTSGISLIYPSDWTVASKDYTDAFFGNPVVANPSSDYDSSVIHHNSSQYCTNSSIASQIIRWC
jgi:hypothetical protein